MTTITTEKLTRNDVVIRPAQIVDRDAVMEIAERTWDGRDYLPRVFDEWLADTDGAFNVMTYREQVVGLSKLTRVADEEWWLEGLRVHPDYQGRGLARIMHHYIVAQARQTGDGIVRFATSGRNAAVLKLASESGFQLVGEYKSFEMAARSEALEGFSSLSIDDLETFKDWLDNSDYYHDADYSFEYRWKWFLGTDDYLQHLLANNQVYRWSADDSDEIHGIAVVSPIYEHRDTGKKLLSLGFADAYSEHRPAFWELLPRLAGHLEADLLRFKMIDDERYTSAPINAGYTILDSYPVLFRRPLSMIDDSQVTPIDPPPTGDDA